MDNPIQLYNDAKSRIKDLEDAVEAWKLQSRDYEDALMEIISMIGDPDNPTEFEPADAVKLVRKMIDGASKK